LPERVQGEIELPDTDPLARYPAVNAFYPELLGLIRKEHPHSRVAVKDSKPRKVVAELLRIDDYSETEVVDTLKWVLTAEHERAEFWRAQLVSPAGLRKDRGEGAGKKFDQMVKARQLATTNGKHSAASDEEDRWMARLKREKERQDAERAKNERDT